MKQLAVAATALALAVPAPASAGGITYDCDTAASHFSELTLPTSGAFQATGKIRLMSVAKSKDFATLARVLVTNDQDTPGPSNEGWAGFTFMTVYDAKKSLPSILIATHRDKGSDPTDETLGLAKDGDVDFSLTYDGSRVEVRIGDYSARMAFSAERPALRIVCSTGEFLIHDLVIAD